MRLRRAAVTVLPAIFLALCVPAPLCAAAPVDFRTVGTPEKQADALLALMSDEDILAQTFMLGWVGADPSPLVLDWISERHIGGVKIFGWNTEDTQRLAAAVGSLQKAAIAAPLKIPLFVATDQEGGWIRHVKGATSETPGNMAIGASGFPKDALSAGYYIGREIAALGINMNFAPSVDLYTNRDSVLIGPRAFGDDPVKVAILGAAFAKGLEKAGVIPTAKHFPGHGDTELDSHGVLPKIWIDQKTMWERELIPYRLLAKERIPAIMSGHLAFPRTPGGEEPASLSKWFLTDLLRGKIGFTGLIITDDLLMNGAAMSAGSLSRAAKSALEAGNDVLMFSKTPSLNDPVWSNLLWAYRNEKAFRARVRDAARRSLVLKLDRLRRSETPTFFPDPKDVVKRVPDAEGRAFFLELASRSVTLIGGKALPLRAATGEKILIAGQFEDFLKIGKKAYPEAKSYRFSYTPFDHPVWAEKEELLRLARDADQIVICVSNPASLEMLQALKDLGKKVYVISALTPVYLDRAPWVDAALAVYSYAPESFTAGFSALSGRIPAEGVLPFPLRTPRSGRQP
ncbi:MAG: glycoside hydrolase family 3 protein [Treponemataceae bacterium]